MQTYGYTSIAGSSNIVASACMYRICGSAKYGCYSKSRNLRPTTNRTLFDPSQGPKKWLDSSYRVYNGTLLQGVHGPRSACLLRKRATHRQAIQHSVLEALNLSFPPPAQPAGISFIFFYTQNPPRRAVPYRAG